MTGPRSHTPEWYAARLSGVGASEVAALLGAHDYLTEEDLFVAKLGGEDKRENLAMRVGSALEPWLLELYRQTRLLENVRPHQAMLRSVEAPHLFATPDAYAWEHCADLDEERYAVVETKVTWADLFDSCPLAWQVQVQAQMAVTGWTRARVAVLHLLPHAKPLDAFQIFDVPRHEGVIDRMRERVEQWWRDHVEARVPPPPGVPGAPIPLRVWEALHPRDSGETVDLPVDAALVDARLSELGRELKRLTAERDELRAHIAAWIGDATYGRLPDGSRWKWGYEERREHVTAASAGRVMRRVGREKRR